MKKRKEKRTNEKKKYAVSTDTIKYIIRRRTLVYFAFCEKRVLFDFFVCISEL